jgi:hypothetical protein
VMSRPDAASARLNATASAATVHKAETLVFETCCMSGLVGRFIREPL